jgi:hypothetical protein
MNENIPKFSATLLTNRSLDGTVTSVHCQKSEPFVYDGIIKSYTTNCEFDEASTDLAEKYCAIVAVGRDDGTVVVYRASYEKKEAPKAGGGLLAKMKTDNNKVCFHF